jgi:hypothetical protein
MSEALWIEHVYKRRYAEWQSDLEAGSAKAMCVLACLIWRRDGRDVPLQDLLDGRVDFDLNEMLASMVESVAAEKAAAEAAEAEAGQHGANPTPAGSAPDGTPGTGTDISGSLPSGSRSGRGKSTKSSASRTSSR